MTRSRRTAKDAGTRFESAITDALAWALKDDQIERRRQDGRDRGDVGGIRSTSGARVVLELKDYGGRVEVGGWMREADAERINDNAAVGAVIFKRRGIADPYAQGVLLSVADLIVLLGGDRP